MPLLGGGTTSTKQLSSNGDEEADVEPALFDLERSEGWTARYRAAARKDTSQWQSRWNSACEKSVSRSSTQAPADGSDADGSEIPYMITHNKSET